jgi:hypothetical protein
VILQVCPLRFEFRALDPISFPPGQAANTFRGAFGEIFRKIACQPDCPGARSCPRAVSCAYARMFEPRANSTDAIPSPSGFGDRPRPFVLRAASLDGRHFETGEKFSLAVNVFDPDLPALDYFRDTFGQLCEEGLGPGRPRIELTDATELPAVQADLAPHPGPVARIRVSFLTPTELKSGGEILREPRFDALFRRTRDRISGLITLYQPDAYSVEPDFRGLGERAMAIRTIASHIEQVEYERRSTRNRTTPQPRRIDRPGRVRRRTCRIPALARSRPVDRRGQINRVGQWHAECPDSGHARLML